MNSDVTLGGAMAGAPQTPQVNTALRYFQIEFTGSGAEYFRIWIVNLLLTLVTLGLYTPWAKVRKLKYFYGNTHIGGHTLDFHGEPKRMLRGYLLVGALFVLVNLSGRVSPLAGVAGLLLMFGLWPALVRASLQFRLANTSWRGLRFRFNGSMAGAYKVFALPLVIFGAFFAAITLLGPGGIQGEGSELGSEATRGKQDPVLAAVMGVFTLAFYGFMPYFWYLLKRYQHNHYGFAQLQTELRVGPGAFYKLFIKAAGVILLCVIAFGTLIAVGGMGASVGKGPAAFFAMVPIFILGFVLLQAVPYPYFMSRMQNLLWSRTGNSQIRFKSDLAFKPLFGLTLKNWILMVLTLGFYWPFVAVSLARMKLEAMSVHTRVDLDTLASETRAKGSQDASGDAAGDLLGIDFGL